MNVESSAFPVITRNEDSQEGLKKISSAKSEDLPELSAGSDESEDLPDPTRARYSRPTGAVNPRFAAKDRS